MAEAPMDAPASSQIDSISWAPSHWTIVGPSWKGFSEIRYLFILYVSFAYTIRTPPPQNRLPAYESASILIQSLSGDSYSQTFGRLPWFVLRARRNSADESSSKGCFKSFVQSSRSWCANLITFMRTTSSSQHRGSFSKELKQKSHPQIPPNNLLRQMSFR
jgi:hypothetical protein